jgi:polar amino acid transport system substrate-binding protein
MTRSDISRRGFLRRASVLGAAAVGAPALLSACESTGGSSGNDVLSTAKKNGYINVGIAGEIPYGYTDKSGAVTGEAPEVARAIFKALGVPQIKAKQVDFSSLIQSLDAGEFDMVAAGMDILPARCKQAQFSVPDYEANVAFLVPAGNPKKVASFADVKRTGVKIAGEVGAVETTYATGSGVSSGQISSFETPDEMLSAVTTGRVYAAMLTDISLKSLVKQNPSAKVEVTPGFKPVIGGKAQGEVGGFVFRKDETSLVNAFNAQLTKMHSNGQWLSIVKPFGFSAANVPPANLTTAELCSGS